MPLAVPPTLESQRLLVRLVVEDDLTGLLKINGDSEVTRFLPYETWQSHSDGEAWLQRMLGIQATGTAWQFVIELKESKEIVGTCLLFRFEEGSARAELGYVLGRAHQGQGLMSEALSSLLGCAFGTLAMRRLEAEIDPRNAASIRLIERLGFVKEGLLRQRWVTKGETNDVEVYGLLRSEWSDIGSDH
jgi:[ribosomal protein S5]-alanine N-acetyltransferase